MDLKCYDSLNRQAQALLLGEDDLVAAMANFSALINDAVEQLNWVGFYLLKDEQLVLGPFQGKVACSRIPLGKGVCGTSAAEKRRCELMMSINLMVILLVIQPVTLRLSFLFSIIIGLSVYSI